jgi:hypothetical protein
MCVCSLERYTGDRHTRGRYGEMNTNKQDEQGGRRRNTQNNNNNNTKRVHAYENVEIAFTREGTMIHA